MLSILHIIIQSPYKTKKLISIFFGLWHSLSKKQILLPGTGSEKQIHLKQIFLQYLKNLAHFYWSTCYLSILFMIHYKWLQKVNVNCLNCSFVLKNPVEWHFKVFDSCLLHWLTLILKYLSKIILRTWTTWI